MKLLFIHVRLSFLVYYYYAFIALSFASPSESENNYDLSLFDNDESMLSSFWGGDSTELAFDPSSLIFWSSGDDQSTFPFDDDSLLLPDLSASMTTFALDQDQDWLAAAATDDECVSLNDQNDQLFIGKRRRANDDTCIPGAVQAARKKKPIKIPSLDPEGWKDPNFPPSGSNPGRLNKDPQNDPFPRPDSYRRNTDFDFKYCPAGLWGYRKYAVCDSGSDLDIEIDATRNMIILINVTPRVFIVSFFRSDSILNSNAVRV